MSRPTQPGLTENELEVMQILWGNVPLKVSEILDHVQRKPKPAYTSLLTLVQTMEKKGYIKHKKMAPQQNLWVCGGSLSPPSW